MTNADEPALMAVVHTVPGRTRLRVPERQHDPPYFADVARRFSDQPLVKPVAVNPHTASILLQHDGTIDMIVADFPDTLKLVAYAVPTRSVAVRVPQFSPANLLQLLVLACLSLGAYQI
jgi:hypothetical protein